MNNDEVTITLTLTPEGAAAYLDALTCAREHDDPAWAPQKGNWALLSDSLADKIEEAVPERMKYGAIGGPVGRARESRHRGEG